MNRKSKTLIGLAFLVGVFLALFPLQSIAQTNVSSNSPVKSTKPNLEHKSKKISIHVAVTKAKENKANAKTSSSATSKSSSSATPSIDQNSNVPVSIQPISESKSAFISNTSMYIRDTVLGLFGYLILCGVYVRFIL